MIMRRQGLVYPRGIDIPGIRAEVNGIGLVTAIGVLKSPRQCCEHELFYQECHRANISLSPTKGQA
jgi:hypothetical protein